MGQALAIPAATEAFKSANETGVTKVFGIVLIVWFVFLFVVIMTIILSIVAKKQKKRNKNKSK
jgi:succinate-acetate transporter protein